MELFPSVEWFRRLAERMDSKKYRRLGPVNLTLIVKIDFDHRSERYCLAFEGYRCTSVRRLAESEAVDGRYPVILEGDYAAWKEMVENVRQHGRADLSHSLNSLTLRDRPFRLAPASQGGQLDVDRFYRYIATLQELFDEAGTVETRLAVPIPSGGATLRQIEREVIVNTLAATKGNQSEAARLLGLGESTLRYRLRKLGIVPFRNHARRPRAEEDARLPGRAQEPDSAAPPDCDPRTLSGTHLPAHDHGSPPRPSRGVTGSRSSARSSRSGDDHTSPGTLPRRRRPGRPPCRGP